MERENGHYSDKGGHFKRSIFNKMLRAFDLDALVPSKEQIHMQIKQMRRIPQDGRK